MSKRKNLTKAAEGRERPLFVQEINNDLKIYIVSQADFDDDSKSPLDGVSCLVLEYAETNGELVYNIKYPETYIILKRGELESLFITD